MKSYNTKRSSDFSALIITIVVVVLAAGGIVYYAYRQHRRAHSISNGGWTYLGTATNAATELGGSSKLATYACIDQASRSEWIVKAKGILSPIPTTPTDYDLTLVAWPYQSLTDAPGGGSESPLKQIKSNAWSSGGVVNEQITIDPSKSNYIEVTAGNKGHGGKILPIPVNHLPSASKLASC